MPSATRVRRLSGPRKRTSERDPRKRSHCIPGDPTSLRRRSLGPRGDLLRARPESEEPGSAGHLAAFGSRPPSQRNGPEERGRTRSREFARAPATSEVPPLAQPCVGSLSAQVLEKEHAPLACDDNVQVAVAIDVNDGYLHPAAYPSAVMNEVPHPFPLPLGLDVLVPVEA